MEKRPGKTESRCTSQTQESPLHHDLTLDRSKNRPSYIVAIGGSAGGLDAFERFFAGIPADTGMAFVVIQHLDPKHKTLMAELLQRAMAMPVREIEDGMKVEPNHVYVIPPNTDLSISDQHLQLNKPSAAHGYRLPIDSFFESLAAECGDRSVAVIVSGMGTDGTQGLKAVKEVGGVVMVESPDSAKFDGMPRSAIGTGLVDYIAPIDELPKELIAYVNHLPRLHKDISESSSQPSSELSRIIGLVSNRTGHDFSLYKKSTLYRRIEKRAGLHQIDGISKYASYAEQHPEEVDALFRELLIGVTRFFRDPEAFEYLEEEIIPGLVNGAFARGAVRVWVTACSTGEEAYSLAILLRECLDRLRPDAGIKIQIFTTDIDDGAIEMARKGLYPANIAADVSTERLDRFFTEVENGYVVKKLIRETVVFAPHNLVADPPFTKMDMVSCRNLLIYFSTELQRKVIQVFHYALNPDGILFLGTAEGVGSTDGLFSTTDGKWKVFRRKETLASQKRMMEIPFRAPIAEAPKFEKLETEAGPIVLEALRQTLLERHTPPTVVVNAAGNIVAVSGRTGKYLEPAEGDATLNITAMAREGLGLELPGALHRAAAHKTIVTLKGLSVKTNGDYQRVDVTVSPLVQPEATGELLVVSFEDAPIPETAGTDATSADQTDTKNDQLQEELAYTKERLQTTLEEMESTSEELKSANEELQSTNEELQSTNEELTTSKEELQSLNEELTTLNTELQSRVDDLTSLNNDIVNLMNSTRLATIFLDNELRIKRFTPAVVGTFNLRSMDIGRPITDITQNLLYETMERDVAEVLRSLVAIEETVESRDGDWFIMRIMPYRTLDNVIDGVVVTYTNVTEMVSLALRNTRLHKAAQQAFQLLKAQHGMLQQALIPVNPQAGPGYKIASRFIAGSPGDQVGGDFFDVFRTEDRELAVVIGDVSGKGVQAASLAAATRSTIRAFTYDRIAPGEALAHTNKLILAQANDPEQFVTVFIAVLDERDGRLRYSSAGHPPAMIRRADGTVELLEMAQTPVGVSEMTVYQEDETCLGPGDALLMYTDGISESHSSQGIYDIEGIAATLEEKVGLTPEETLEALFKAAMAAGNGTLLDDAAVVIIERDSLE